MNIILNKRWIFFVVIVVLQTKAAKRVKKVSDTHTNIRNEGKNDHTDYADQKENEKQIFSHILNIFF